MEMDLGDMPSPDFARHTSAVAIQDSYRRHQNHKKNKERAVVKVQRRVRMFLLQRPYPPTSDKEAYLAESMRRFYLLKVLFQNFSM